MLFKDLSPAGCEVPAAYKIETYTQMLEIKDYNPSEIETYTQMALESGNYVNSQFEILYGKGNAAVEVSVENGSFSLKVTVSNPAAVEEANLLRRGQAE